MRALLVAACIAALTACGGTSTPVAGANREWIANTGGVIDELERDLTLAVSGGDTVATARKALHDESSLYTILVAYTDFGGCRHMVAAAGSPPARFAAAERALASACALLEHAAALFTHATTAHDAQALVAADRATRRATPFLLRAKAALSSQSPGQ
jgi:hypothetical protein